MSEENKNIEKKLEITYVPARELKFASYNPKGFNSKQFSRLDMSIEKFGFLMPVLVNKRTGNVVDGNQRLKKVLQKGNLEELVPTVFIDVDLDTEKKMNVALNKTSTPEDQEKMLELLREFDGDDLMQKLMEDYKDIDKTIKESKMLGEYSITREVDEKHNYIVALFDKSVDFSNIETFFNLGTVYDAMKGKTIGLGRVIDGEKLIKLINIANKNGYKNIAEFDEPKNTDSDTNV